MRLQCLLSPLKRAAPLPSNFLTFLSIVKSSASASYVALNETHLDEQLYSKSLGYCIESLDLRYGAALHAHFLKSSGSSIFVLNHLVNMYVKFGDLVDGLKLFDEMPVRNVVSWTTMISGFVQQNCCNEALSLFRSMHFAGERPNGFSLVSVLNACSLAGDFFQLLQIYGLVVRLGLDSNVFLMNAFLSGLIRLGRYWDAFLIFEDCPNKDVVSWNAIMAGYLQCALSHIPAFWCRMNMEHGVKPDHYTFSTVLTGLAGLGDQEMGAQVHAQLVKCGHGSEVCIGNSLVDMYLKSHNLVDGFKAFHEMPSRNVLSWTQMAAGCLNCGQPGHAITVIEEMQLAGIRPNRFTLATLINACANIALLEEGKKAHGIRLKLGTEADVCVDNALLDMYAKCGCMEEASVVFCSMKDRSVVSWTTMIMGHAQNCQGKEAISCYDEMTKLGMQPNYVTFISVLHACNHTGNIDKAWEFFSSMSSIHGIDPGEDHYTCMVDILGRAGQTKEAKELISIMPFKPSALIWKTLAAACRVHGDVETGLLAAERAMSSDQNDPSTYVLLSNMYANLSHWDDVSVLRKVMVTSKGKKMAGSSWVS